MRIRYYIPALLFFISPLFCRAGKMYLSGPVDNTECLQSKVVQCSNGNTLLFCFTAKEGIRVRIFDREHVLLNMSLISGKAWNNASMHQSAIAGIFEINGQIVLFLQQKHNRVPSLFRLTFDRDNGQLVEEQQVKDLRSYVRGADFSIEKDPGSDHYAIVTRNRDATENCLAYYDGRHQVINRSIYHTPDSAYQHIKCVAMYVDGSKQVFIANYAYNDRSVISDKRACLYLSRIAATDPVIVHKTAEGIIKNPFITKAILLSDARHNKMQLLTMTARADETLAPFTSASRNILTTFDPVSLAIIQSKTIDNGPINQHRVYKRSRPAVFAGTPRNIIINPDCSLSMLLEEYSFTLVFHGSAHYHTEDLGLMTLDSTGEVTGRFLFPKDQVGKHASALSLHDQANNTLAGMSQYDAPNFTGGDFAVTNAAHYIFYNDMVTASEIDAVSSAEAVNETDFPHSNTICYKVGKDSVTRSFLFGTPDSSFDNRYAYINAGNYMPATQTYATLIIERKGKHSQARMAWIKFD